MKKRIIVLCVIVALIGAILAVQHFNKKDVSVKEPATTGKGSATTQNDEEQIVTFGFSCSDLSNPYYAAMEASLRYAVEEDEAALVTIDAEGDQDKQNRDLMELVEENVDVILFVPVTFNGADETIKQITSARIPVICMDSRNEDQTLVTSFIGSDNTKAGSLCGKDLAKRMTAGGTVVILESYDSQSVTESISGFEHAIAGKGFSVIGRQDCGGTREAAAAYISEFLSNRTDITAIMSGSDMMALGVLDAIELYNQDRDDNEKLHPFVYGVGGYPEIKEILSHDETLITATAATSPIQVGQDAASYAFKINSEEKVESEVLEQPYLINRRNIRLYGIDGWQ